MIFFSKQKWKGGQSGTYLRQVIGVGSAGERRQDIDMKQKIYRISEAFEQKHCVFRQ